MILGLLMAASLAQGGGMGQSQTGMPDVVLQDKPQTLEELLQDVDSSNRGARTFAARELRRQARIARRGVDKPPRDALRAEELAVRYSDLRRDAIRPTTRCLEHRNVRRICAQILTLLPSPQARPALESALEAEERKRVRKHLTAALAAIREQEAS